jgi:hypothetical protein
MFEGGAVESSGKRKRILVDQDARSLSSSPNKPTDKVCSRSGTPRKSPAAHSPPKSNSPARKKQKVSSPGTANSSNARGNSNKSVQDEISAESLIFCASPQPTLPPTAKSSGTTPKKNNKGHIEHSNAAAIGDKIVSPSLTVAASPSTSSNVSLPEPPAAKEVTLVTKQKKKPIKARATKSSAPKSSKRPTLLEQFKEKMGFNNLNTLEGLRTSDDATTQQLLNIQQANNSRMKLVIDNFEGTAKETQSHYIGPFIAWFKYCEEKKFIDNITLTTSKVLAFMYEVVDKLRIGSRKGQAKKFKSVEDMNSDDEAADAQIFDNMQLNIDKDAEDDGDEIEGGNVPYILIDVRTPTNDFFNDFLL